MARSQVAGSVDPGWDIGVASPFGPHVAGWLIACSISVSDTVSTLLLPPSSFPSIPLFRFVVRVVAQVGVIVAASGTIFGAAKLVDESVEHPEYSEHYGKDSNPE